MTEKYEGFYVSDEVIRKFIKEVLDYANYANNDPRNVGHKIVSENPRLYAEVEFCVGCGWTESDQSTYLALKIDGDKFDSLSIDAMPSYDFNKTYMAELFAMDALVNPT